MRASKPALRRDVPRARCAEIGGERRNPTLTRKVIPNCSDAAGFRVQLQASGCIERSSYPLGSVFRHDDFEDPSGKVAFDSDIARPVGFDFFLIGEKCSSEQQCMLSVMKSKAEPSLAARCPTCGAKPGEECELSTGQPRTEPQEARRMASPKK